MFERIGTDCFCNWTLHWPWPSEASDVKQTRKTTAEAVSHHSLVHCNRWKSITISMALQREHGPFFLFKCKQVSTYIHQFNLFRDSNSVIAVQINIYSREFLISQIIHNFCFGCMYPLLLRLWICEIVDVMDINIMAHDFKNNPSNPAMHTTLTLHHKQ